MKVKVTKKDKNPPQEVAIATQYIQLDAFLKWCTLCETGGQAKEMIQEGLIFVNGEKCLQRGKKLYLGDTVTFEGQRFIIIGNGDGPGT